LKQKPDTWQPEYTLKRYFNEADWENLEKTEH